VLGALGATLGLTVLFAGALVVAVVVHLDLAPTRRVVRAVVNEVLATTFQGSIVLGPIDRLSLLHGVAVREARALDARGVEVARIEGLRATPDVPTLAHGLLLRGGQLHLPVSLIHLDHVDVNLDPGPEGRPAIAGTFLLRNPKPAPPSAVPARVTLERIEIDSITAHGAVVPTAVIDGKLAHLVGVVRVDAGGVRVDVEPAHLEAQARPALPVPVEGDVSFHLLVPPSRGAEPGPLRLETGFDGHLGPTELHLGAVLDGNHLRARVEAPRVTPEAIVSFLPDKSTKLPIHQPVSVVATADGDLPDLRVEARLGLEDGGGLDARGKLALGAPPSLELDFGVHRFDPRVVLDVAAATPLDAEGHVRLGFGSDLVIDARVTTKPLSLAGNPIPGLTAQASLARGVWKGSAHADEDGAPTDASVTFDAQDGLRFEVESDARSLRAVRRLGAPVDGSVRVKVAGTLKDGAIDARVTGKLGQIRAPGDVALDDGTLEAHVRGPVAAPTVEASLRGRGVRAGKYSGETIEARASGPLDHLVLETSVDLGGGESIKAGGALDARARSLRGVKLSVKKAGASIEGTVAQIASTPRGVEIEGLALHGEGVGDLEGGLRVQGKELVGKLRGRDVDLGRVTRMAGLPLRVSGLANVDVDLTSSGPGQRHGTVALELVNGEAAGVTGLSGQLAATFTGERIHLDGLLRLIARAGAKEPARDRCDGAIASIRLSGGDGRLDGGLLDPATWARASGKLTVAAEDWNLRCLARLGPVEMVLGEVRGKLTTRADLERLPGARFPSVKHLLARTRGLEVAGLGDEKPEWESRQMDVEVRGSFDPASGATSARLTLLDGSPIATLGGRAALDPAAFLDHPERRAELLRKTPVQLTLAVPRRAIGAFGTLPSFVRDHLPPLAGDVAVDATITGSLERPRLEARASGWDVALTGPMPEQVPNKQGQPASEIARVPAESPWGLPVNLDVVVAYDQDQVTATAHARRKDVTVAEAEVELKLALADLLSGKPIRPTGNAEARLTRVPLDDIPFCADRGISGHVDGSLKLDGIGTAPTLKLGVAVPDLKVGSDLTYDEAAATVEITRPRGKEVDRGAANARVSLSSAAGGKLSVNAFSEIVWKDGLTVPTVDPARPADLIAKATHFRIAVLGPFLAGVLSRVDGTLDGDARLGWTRLDSGDSTRMGVHMKLTGGLFHVPQLGQELHSAEIELSGGGGGVVMLDRIVAYGTKGRITGKGQARFVGLEMTRAEAGFEIKPGEDMPITLEGVPLGDASGKLSVVAATHGRDLDITVGIPRLDVSLPASTGRSVQSLSDNPDVLILQDPRYARAPRHGEATRLALTVNLGDISVKGGLFDIALTGVKTAPIRVEVYDKTRLSGDIVLTRGRFEVLKKQFQIEQGVVHLRPDDPANPYVNVTARWDSPDGAPVYIEYAGVLLPIEEKKIKYHSPKIPDDQIMATLLFGGVEQSTLGGAGDRGGGSVPGQSLATSLIAQQFSTQIAGNISTSIGANEDGTFRPGLVYNTGDKVIELSTYGATGQGATAAGGGLKGQRTLVTVDWRFWRNWLLRGRVDAGSDQTVTGVDVLWQYRY
jgi:translocation and assembly module TamB